MKRYPGQVLAALLILGVTALLSACGGLVNHRVEKGETLYAIGWRYGQDYRDIARWNNLKPPYTIYEGQWLRVAPPVAPWWQDDYPDLAEARQRQATRSKKKPPPRQVRATPPRVAMSAAPRKEVAMPRGRWRWPVAKVDGAKIRRVSRHRKGISIGGRLREPILAAAAGKVVYRGSGLVGLGKLIIIKHNRTFLSAYAHNAEFLVQEGDSVRQGQPIARMGRTDAGEVLLYFEIRKNGKPVDPLNYLPRLQQG